MGDILNIEKINALGQIIVDFDGSNYDLEFVCVHTGCARINVVGQPQCCDWSDFRKILDWNMNEYDPDFFYSDYDDS